MLLPWGLMAEEEEEERHLLHLCTALGRDLNHRFAKKRKCPDLLRL